MSQELNLLIEKCQGYEMSFLQSEYTKRCQSNYLKNIARSFTRFILEQGDEIIITSLTNSGDKSLNQLRREFIQFMRYKAYNQSTLISILKSSRFGMVFHYYLQYYSESWLLESNAIKDLYGHIICIEYLIRAFKEQNILDNFKVYKKIKQNELSITKKCIKK